MPLSIRIEPASDEDADHSGPGYRDQQPDGQGNEAGRAESLLRMSQNLRIRLARLMHVGFEQRWAGDGSHDNHGQRHGDRHSDLGDQQPGGEASRLGS